MYHVENYEGFLYLYVCVHCCSDDSSSRASGKLGPPQGALNKRLDSSNMLPLLFVPHLHTHSLSNRLNEMGSSALCEGKRMKIMATQAK